MRIVLQSTPQCPCALRNVFNTHDQLIYPLLAHLFPDTNLYTPIRKDVKSWCPFWSHWMRMGFWRSASESLPVEPCVTQAIESKCRKSAWRILMARIQLWRGSL